MRLLGNTLNGLKDWEKPRVINTGNAPTYAAALDLLPIVGPASRSIPGISRSGWAICARPICQHYRRLIADRAVWTNLVVVSTPSLQLFPCVGKRQKPVRVQTFGFRQQAHQI
jgi:hypothetical protein